MSFSRHPDPVAENNPWTFYVSRSTREQQHTSCRRSNRNIPTNEQSGSRAQTVSSSADLRISPSSHRRRASICTYVVVLLLLQVRRFNWVKTRADSQPCPPLSSLFDHCEPPYRPLVRYASLKEACFCTVLLQTHHNDGGCPSTEMLDSHKDGEAKVRFSALFSPAAAAATVHKLHFMMTDRRKRIHKKKKKNLVTK